MGDYCECCGRKNDDILRKLHEQEWSNDKHPTRKWEGHFHFKSHPDDIYYSNYLKYCSNCGELLNGEDIKTIRESRGEFWGAPCSETIIVGYMCSKCKYKEDF